MRPVDYGTAAVQRWSRLEQSRSVFWICVLCLPLWAYALAGCIFLATDRDWPWPREITRHALDDDYRR